MRNLTACLALAALLFSALAFSRSLAAPPKAPAMPLVGRETGEPTSNAEQAEQMRRFDQRLSEIEARLALREDFSTPASREVAEDVPRVEDLAARLLDLEKALVEAKQREQLPSMDTGKRDSDASLEQHISNARDPSVTTELKLASLRELRGKKLSDGTDARLPVLDEMISIGQFAPDAEHRADVWRQLSRVTDPRLRQPLLDALANDPDPEAREEAAETLAHFLPDANVEQALLWAADHDAAENVREQAQGSVK